MAKRRYATTESGIARRLKQRRGLGHGSVYRPWLTIHDVSSHGLSSRPPGITTGRIHHLLSNNEAALFYEADWSSAVTDIREQFPLPRGATRALAADMGVIHPRDGRVDVVMTTDFLLDIRGRDDWLSFPLPAGDGKRLLAIAIKPDDVAYDRRALDKLEIERRYWAARRVEWQLLLGSQLPRARLLKLQWLLEWWSLDHMDERGIGFFLSGCRTLLARLAVTSGGTAGEFLSGLDATFGWEPGTGLSMARHLASRRRLVMDTDTPFDSWGPLSQLGLPAAAAFAAKAA